MTGTAIPAMSAISKNPDGVGYEGIGAMSANAYEGMAHAHAIAAARASPLLLVPFLEDSFGGFFIRLNSVCGGAL